MTIRYFYTDPLAASWMAKHFKMQFEYLDMYYGDHWMEPASLELMLNASSRVGKDSCELGKLYIHPDSLHLLEPKEGDGVEFDRWHWGRQRDSSLADAPYQPNFGRVLLFKNKRPDGGDWMQISSTGIGWDDNHGGQFALPFKIIQRFGMPYFWPECEAA